MSGASRSRVLSLYRTILRTGRTWKGPLVEREYIAQEAKTLFRQNKHISSPEELEAKLREGEERLELAVHYHIPYPRLHHAPQFKRREYQDIPIIK